MKKVVIILLLILPFILIYFISITGRILEKYSHIYVESLMLESIDDEKELSNGDTVSIGKDKTSKFKIIIGPALASNPDITINNFNQDTCKEELNGDILEITGLKYGNAKIVITSVDRTNITFTLNIKITDDVPTSFTISKKELSIKTKLTQLDLIDLGITWYPQTTKVEYKGLIFTSSDSSIVEVIDEEIGLIKGLKEGSVIVTITSKFNAELKQELKINVTNAKDSDIYFDYYETNALLINYNELNLYSMVKYSEAYKEKYTDEELKSMYIFEVSFGASNINLDSLKNGTLIFNSEGIVKIKIVIDGKEIDSITIKYIK